MSDPLDQKALWEKVLDAKLQLDLAWNYLKEVAEDAGVPQADRLDAYERAFAGQEAAREAYLSALSAFKARVLNRQTASASESF